MGISSAVALVFWITVPGAQNVHVSQPAVYQTVSQCEAEAKDISNVASVITDDYGHACVKVPASKLLDM